MNKHITKRLLERFPVIYQNYYSSIQESCLPWGFEVGIGWYRILWQLSLAIEDELGYTYWQKKKFLLKRKLSRGWNSFIYKLSPPVREQFVVEIDGKLTKKWEEKKDILQRIMLKLFRKRIYRVGKYSVIQSLQHLGLKYFTWWPYTGFAVDQVKEKFGTLRFYCPSYRHIHDYVEIAERASSNTCEECGKWGTLVSDKGWSMVRCIKHTPKGAVKDGQDCSI